MTPSACGAFGVAGIGQLAHIAVGQGRRPGGRASAELPGRLMDEEAGTTAGLPAARRAWRRLAILQQVVAGRRRLAEVAAEPVPSPGSLSPVPGRLRGELGAGGEVKLGEHVSEVGLHGPA